MKLKLLSFVIVINIFLGLMLPGLLVCAPADYYTAKVKDISDRAYEKAVIDLLDHAQKSIVMSMYIIRPLKSGLVGDLKEALARGVTVEIYHNTKFDYPWGEPFELKNAFLDLNPEFGMGLTNRDGKAHSIFVSKKCEHTRSSM